MSVENVLGIIPPQDYVWHAAYPNPFNSSTRIRFGIPEASVVRLEIYNMFGISVAQLADDELGVGTYEAIWKAENIPSGMYIVRMTARSMSSSKQFSSSQRVMLVK